MSAFAEILSTFRVSNVFAYEEVCQEEQKIEAQVHGIEPLTELSIQHFLDLSMEHPIKQFVECFFEHSNECMIEHSTEHSIELHVFMFDAGVAFAVVDWILAVAAQRLRALPPA